MEKRDLLQMIIYEIDNDAATLSMECLKPLYIKKTSEIVYITKNNKIYGIVCLGDVLRHKSGMVKINTIFCSLESFNTIKAREILKEKKNINKIPIISEKGELLGDYSRWDDMLFVERNYKWFAQKELIEKTLGPYKTVYIVEPNDNGNSSYLYFIQCLGQFKINYVVLKKNNCDMDYANEDILVFLNEEERRGVQCLLQVDLGKDEKPKNPQRKEKWVTFKSLLIQMIKARDLKVIAKLGNFSIFPDQSIDEKASVLFAKLKEKGVHCLAIYANDGEITEYTQQFREALAERLQKSPCIKEVPWITGETAEKFWDELYLLEDYKSGAAQKEILEGWLKGRYENLDGKYCKMKSGRRNTCYQPDEYIGTIYFLGPCIVFGAYVEDQYTIESYLQKYLLEIGYPYRVENYASPLRLDAELEDRLMEIDNYHREDIVIYLSQAGEVAGIQNCSLWDIYDSGHVSIDWVTNWYLHCNHKTNQIIANHILSLIEPSLLKTGIGNSNIHMDFDKVMKEYVNHKYLRKYFSNFENKYSSIGAIVMNCNPFSKGHRYLIEQAKAQVDFLIIFVVEEDMSLFSFEERYQMVAAGTKDLDHVMVVPSGEFILSQNTFQEYFTKVETELIMLNAEYDIRVFADYIAQPLHITHRFAGEEPFDRVTSIYNDAMKKILPQKGITFVEIPRVEIQDLVVSASKIREYLKSGNNNMAAALLPESTISFLME